MKEVAAKVQMDVGTRADGRGVTEMEYNPHQLAVIFRDKDGNEVLLNPSRLRLTLKEFGEFVALLERLGVKTK